MPTRSEQATRGASPMVGFFVYHRHSLPLSIVPIDERGGLARKAMPPGTESSTSVPASAGS